MDKETKYFFIYALLEYWFGKNKRVQANSLIDFLLRIIFRRPMMVSEQTKEVNMEIGQSGVFVEYKEGKAVVSAYEGAIVLEIKAALVINPALDKLSAKVESGEIDLIKGTDLDKAALLKAIELVKTEINK